jgi:hypothetical protein
MKYGKKIWGPLTWYLLHIFSIHNYLKKNNDLKHNYFIFYTSFIHILPCIICSKHYSDIINFINPIEEEKIDNRYIKKWVYNSHNIVNDLLNKKIYKYSKLKHNYKDINNNKIFFILKILIKNIDFSILSLYKYDQIYNFFINFCLLYPEQCIKNKLELLIKDNEFKKIETPKQFIKWYNNYFLNFYF